MPRWGRWGVLSKRDRVLISVSSFLSRHVRRFVFLLYMEEFSLSIWLQKSSRHIHAFRHLIQTAAARFVQGEEMRGRGEFALVFCLLSIDIFGGMWYDEPNGERRTAFQIK